METNSSQNMFTFVYEVPELKNSSIFHPFSNTNKNRQHELMIHTSSKCGHVDYGTKLLREENPEKLKGKKDYSEATRPIVPEDNTDLSGFYSRPAGALSATGVAGARLNENYPADLNPPHPGDARPIVHRLLGSPGHDQRWHILDST
ncbi:UNVERIFIED_CONTAM: hypothetical protein FKN15_017348 [Acipenser sinensis]